MHGGHRGVLGLVSPDVLKSKLSPVAENIHVVGAGPDIPEREQRMNHINVVSAPTSPVRAVGVTLRRSPEVPNVRGEDDDHGGSGDGGESPSEIAHPFLGIRLQIVSVLFSCEFFFFFVFVVVCCCSG